MKKCSTKTHKSFVLSDQLTKSRRMQIFANILLLFIFGVQIYNLAISINLFSTIKF